MESVTYKGFEIEIHQDRNYENPFKVWDCEFPLMYGEGRSSEDFSDGDIDHNLLYYLSDNQMTRHMGKILKMIEYRKEEFDKHYPPGDWDKGERRGVLWDEFAKWLTRSLENRASFCQEFGIKHYYGTSTGYSQGDRVDVFICWSPTFGKTTGHQYKDVTEEGFKATKKTFDAWMWGDVYGYSIDGVNVGSCWGYFGDPLESGLLAEAESCIDYHLECVAKETLEQKKKRENRIKAMIKNDVPLIYRVNV
jgi:hypothetical protein